MIAFVILGFVLPVLTGTVVSYLALIVLCLARGWRTFSLTVLLESPAGA